MTIIHNPLDDILPDSFKRRISPYSNTPWCEGFLDNTKSTNNTKHSVSNTDSGKKYEFLVPGVRIEDISVSIDDNNQLVIVAEIKSKNYALNLLTKSTFSCKLLKDEEILSAELENGILTILTKVVKKESKKIDIVQK